MIVVADDVPQVRLEAVVVEGVSVLPCPRKEGKLALAWLMERLATLSVTSISKHEKRRDFTARVRCVTSQSREPGMTRLLKI